MDTVTTSTAEAPKDPMIVVLAHPITVNGLTYTQLNLRRMKGRDALLGEGEQSEVMAGYKLFAALAQVDVDVVLDLDMEDLTELGVAIAPLMGKRGAAMLAKLTAPPSNGETSSSP
ncbi:MAG: phage tail assembly protein [Candidatus Devosia phytovorans]|uniref:Phage tail assembly protein n=1 Tax=Candidatus Devosia phytovorans TaxID=3121372 RepID=A0AAJ5VTK0_9HYPH|nr:phage tail assembly protein [Devosia sp.]WEK04573.1 MAG: phage tail assembly protein [Devosia sp.]